MKLNFYSIYNLFRLILVDQQCLSPHVLAIFVFLHIALIVFNIVPSSCLLLLKLGQNAKKSGSIKAHLVGSKFFSSLCLTLFLVSYQLLPSVFEVIPG